MLSQMSHQIIILIKSIFRSVIVNQVESQYELCNVWATRAERLENLFVCLSTPPSSKMHCFFKVRKHKLKLESSETLRKSILKLKSWTKQYCSLFFCNRVMCTCLYKSETHVMNYCKLKLSADIEKNLSPRPVYVDPRKRIAEPSSQGNELVFGENAGQQCVAVRQMTAFK